MASDRLTTHGVAAIGATVCEVRRGGVRIGHIRKVGSRGLWEFQPEGWNGWTGDTRLMRDAMAGLAATSDEQEATP